MRTNLTLCLIVVGCSIHFVSDASRAEAPANAVSHPPLRRNPPAAQRVLATGPAYFVDARQGDDTVAGTQAAPWKTLRHALLRLRAGDTLYVREGVYRENVYVALAGQEKLPITIRGYPGETAVIDGSFREFFDAPETAWEPMPAGAPHEFRSVAKYPNLRNLVGSFGDSMIGLQTYFHAQDLRATNELVDWIDWDRTAESDLKPLYCGPGMWYDRQSGYIHVRLAHTHLPEPIDNYRGPTDPRKVPLLIAPFHSVPLHVDHAEHVRFQDLIVRGAGYSTVLLDHAVDVEFDNVTVWCGTYGMRAMCTGPLRLLNSALHGNLAPWTFRNDASKRDYPGRPHRNISRMNTHALIEIGTGLESSVFATPQNDRWEIEHCEFTDAHDGAYFGAINVQFHHNLIENMQDDGIYLSPMYLRHRLDKTDPQIHIHENVIRQVLTALAFGGPEPVTHDRVFVYRNVFDLRGPVRAGRPSVKQGAPSFSNGHLMGDHGSPPWSAINFYHNTSVMSDPARDAAMGSVGSNKAGHPRRVFNNIYYHVPRLPPFPLLTTDENVVSDGNLFWSPQSNAPQDKTFFDKFRKSEPFTRSRSLYEPGSTTHSLVGDPKFAKALPEPSSLNDYRLTTGSAAVDSGIDVAADWPDPLRKADSRKPDIGAIPVGVNLWSVGREQIKK
jgi:hypothetical protein